MRFYLLNVFTKDDQNGNQLAAVFPETELSDEKMQSIAREFHFSETIFIYEKEHPSVRIFTPKSELPFAGHPTVGAAWLLNHLKGSVEKMEVRLGLIRAQADETMAEIIFPGMGQVSTYNGNLEELLKHSGLSMDDVHYRLVKNVNVGPEFTVIPVKNRAILSRAHSPESFSEPVKAYYVFPESDTSYHVRMFAPVLSVKEDAATGSAACALAVYLRSFMQVPKGKVTVHQGLEMGRPCAIELEWGDVIKIGGAVKLWGQGTLN